MKVIVAGGRRFNNYELVCNYLDPLKELIDEIVEGEAKGADLLGKRYGEDNGIRVKEMPADWSIGKSAGYKRNTAMAEYIGKGILLAFWDGESKGTKHMIDIATAKGLDVIIVLYAEQILNDETGEYICIEIVKNKS